MKKQFEFPIGTYKVTTTDNPQPELFKCIQKAIFVRGGRWASGDTHVKHENKHYIDINNKYTADTIIPMIAISPSLRPTIKPCIDLVKALYRVRDKVKIINMKSQYYGEICTIVRSVQDSNRIKILVVLPNRTTFDYAIESLELLPYNNMEENSDIPIDKNELKLLEPKFKVVDILRVIGPDTVGNNKAINRVIILQLSATFTPQNIYTYSPGLTDYQFPESSLELVESDTVNSNTELINPYLKYHNKSGLKVGDTVKIIKEISPQGWENIWTSNMRNYIGSKGQIYKDRGVNGFQVRIKENNSALVFYFPCTSLEKITDKFSTITNVVDLEKRYNFIAPNKSIITKNKKVIGIPLVSHKGIEYRFKKVKVHSKINTILKIKEKINDKN
jgi:hypothetical protein